MPRGVGTQKRVREYCRSKGYTFCQQHRRGKSSARAACEHACVRVGHDKRWLAAHGIDADELAGIAALSGQSITHFTIRAERGISTTTPVVDDLALLFHVRKDAPPLLLLTGDRNREIMGRFEETASFHRMLREAGHPTVGFRELPGCDHTEMVDSGYPLLLDFVRRHSQRPGR